MNRSTPQPDFNRKAGQCHFGRRVPIQGGRMLDYRGNKQG
jgi:hypothetical protein